MSQEGYAESRDIMLKAWNTMLLFFWEEGGWQSQGRGKCRKREGKALFSTLGSALVGVGVILILLLWGP